MSVSNESTDEGSMTYSQVYEVEQTEGQITKIAFTVSMALFFTYLNAIMAYTLWSKPVLKETSRYILFNHMLVNDSIQFLCTSFLFAFAQTYTKLAMPVCAIMAFVSTTTFFNTPLNLAVMSLERYVAICFPLRHADIATQKNTNIAIGVTWFFGSINYIIDFLYGVIMDSNLLTLQMTCTRQTIYVKNWQVNIYHGFNAVFFVLVTVIILYTYISILITARSISSVKDSATKAHKTVLLHLIQLGLCLASILFGVLERAVAMAGITGSLFMDLQYIIYLFVVMVPRCLSPLIYGLRDDAVRPLFMYYFCFGRGKHTPTVNVH